MQIYTQKNIYEHVLTRIGEKLDQPSLANGSYVYTDNRDNNIIRCTYSFTNLTEYSNSTKNKFTCQTVSYINNGTGVMTLSDIGFSKIESKFYENTYYHIDTTYYILKSIYPTYVQIPQYNWIKYFNENPQIIKYPETEHTELIDCTEDFDSEHNVVSKNVFVRFPDSKYIDYKDSSFGKDNYNSAFTPNYLYEYQLQLKSYTHKNEMEQAVNIFNSSTGTLSLKSEYITNNSYCTMICKVYNDPDNFFAASTNSIEQKYVFKKLLPMKFDIPNNTYEVYLNECIEKELEESQNQNSNKELTKYYNNTPLRINLFDIDEPTKSLPKLESL